MLTLFKPWRNGKDLKLEHQSWDEAFEDHPFTNRQNQLMDHFNVRYECNDARDDFSAQTKQKVSGTVHFPPTDELSDFENGQGDDEGDDEGEDRVNYGVDAYSILGPYGKVIQAQMDATENCMRNAGWLDECPDGMDHVDIRLFKAEVMQPAEKWKTIIQDAQQNVLTERCASNSKHKSVQRMENNIQGDGKVIIVDQSYLNQGFQAKHNADQTLLNMMVLKFNLNKEQERAFRIVGNHAVSQGFEQLKMYLGGMGGTGKSQVIRALKELFLVRKESYRFLIMGPTGTSAALLAGSTYHSVLGINMNNSRQGAAAIAQVQARLEGVDYIFIDEVSMVTCHDSYKISAQLAKARGMTDLPFGGLNMIFAGDFAQLPPVGGASLYTGAVGTQVEYSMKPHMQEAAVGKALWHQVTTVVILRENMRQRSQSPEDALFRTALTNMRYGACTPDDIHFLQSRIAGRHASQPKVASKYFRNVPIICGIHSQKDKINELGCDRFAEETGQTLTTFYSKDKWGKRRDPALRLKRSRHKVTSKTLHHSENIDFDTQKEIWKLRHGATEHFAGKLSLCIGMPVMIRNNEATELCITKGQEGFVAGWQADKGLHGKQVLDTLFVRLDNPPQPIHIPGLPENIVPLVKGKKTIECTFPSDMKENIERQQVWVLPNFAMTAHASQGKTRQYNVVHLNSCTSHMAYYTALSRSASASGTIIIQGFDSRVITRGCSGYLRQEFREQEILDDITQMIYEGHLPEHVKSELRNSLISNYRQWKGESYVPEKVDLALRWSNKDPFITYSAAKDSQWHIVEMHNKVAKDNAKEYINPKGSQPHYSPHKRATENLDRQCIKKQKTQVHNYPDMESIHMEGLAWDGINWSCAYDSLFVIIHMIWKQNPQIWTDRLKALGSTYLTLLVDGFSQVTQRELTLEAVRDDIRRQLHSKHPIQFPMGHVGTSVAELAVAIMTPSDPVSICQVTCLNCGFRHESRQGYVLHATTQLITITTSQWMDSLSETTNILCPECLLEAPTLYNQPPTLLCLEYPNCNLITSHVIKVKTAIGTRNLYLRGIVYHGRYHFTSRIIDKDGRIWYHDGMTTGKTVCEDGNLQSMTNQSLAMCRARNLVLAVYACL